MLSPKAAPKDFLLQPTEELILTVLALAVCRGEEGAKTSTDLSQH